MSESAFKHLRPGRAQTLGHPRVLVQQVRWLIALRWIAAGAVLLGSLVDWRFTGWFDHSREGVLLGVALIGVNVLMRIWVHRSATLLRRPRRLMAVIWTQIAADLLMLSLLAIWTGGLASPVLGFFVFHMVFASLLLGSARAYAAATLGAAMFFLLLCSGGEAPSQRDDVLRSAGFLLTIYLTVLIVNRITQRLRDHERRALSHHARILDMSRRLREQQQAMAQHEKMVALGQLAAGVAHEIANPLASMDSVLQLMQRRPEAAPGGAVATLRQQVERIHLIVRQMTSFARPESPLGTPLPLGQLVDRVLQVVDLDRRLDRIKVVRDIPESTARDWMMPPALQQVLVNLAINAIDAMENAAAPVLTIAAEQRNGVLSLRVGDTGTGISPEHLERIFEPFFTTKPVGKGTGLGLSVSYRIIEHLGGRIDVASRPGSGTTFSITLPAAIDGARRPATPRSSEDGAPA